MAEPVLKVTELNPADATPMMKQYLSIKQAHQDYLLFYRMGDFYELFFEDAHVAARALDIALTKRGQHKGEDIPMCGVPFHSSEQYLHKLIKSGYKVAVCEQTEDPQEAKKRGAKSVVRREVVRIITPGTITEDYLLDSNTANFLVSIAKVGNDTAIAWADISTGMFEVTTASSKEAVISEISRLSPKEILIADDWLGDKGFMGQIGDWKKHLTSQVASFFDSTRAERKIKDFYGMQTIESLGLESRAEISACGALLEYAGLTQKENTPRLALPKHFSNSKHMQIDSSTRRNLELTYTTFGEYAGSLLSIIDDTVSSAGARLLRQNISSPLLSQEVIESRLDMVEYFFKNPETRRSIRNYLKAIPDIERSLARLYVGRGGPRDLLVIRTGLLGIFNVLGVFENCSKETFPVPLVALLKQLDPQEKLLNLLSEALCDEVPHLTRDGGFVRDGYNPKLDEFRDAHSRGAELKFELRDKYRNLTGIDKLKVGENNLIGMYIEVSSQHVNNMPDGFVHRQTLANAIRYSTPELKELENKIINAEHSALILELEVFDYLLKDVLDKSDDISLSAHALAALDVAASHAELAENRKYTRPQLNDSDTIEIKGGRHPVVEAYLRSDFIANDCTIKPGQNLWLLTGPNMAGKSTFLRQNALIIILAQIGCFVPAEKAEIGLVDRIFSRVGASDDLARGQSTFMVEMVETATILNQATGKSFVILDEIGRGTATFDGLSIAWAVIEYLHDVNKCRSLFATHYHELTSLSDRLKNLACYTMKVKEWNNDIIFMHEVMTGVADRSYGIHVGKLAGLPKAVTERAEKVLAAIQNGDEKKSVNKLSKDLPLFSQESKAVVSNKKDSELTKLFEDIDPDSLSPKQALEMLYKLKAKSNDAD